MKNVLLFDDQNPSKFERAVSASGGKISAFQIDAIPSNIPKVFSRAQFAYRSWGVHYLTHGVLY